MRILITNIRLAMRTGTEIVVRDLALRLSERQHEVTVFSPEIGKFADEVTSRGIAVVDDLLKIAHAPDVIHGHHMPCTGQAILAFPQAPVIWVCHSASAWFDAPPRFSQVRRIFAVDETCRKRLIETDDIPADAVDILPNAVDLRRCPPRAIPLPAKPARGLSLVKHGGVEPIIAEACRRADLALEAHGHGVGREIDDVEQRCAQAEIVFATARTALEAMASGAAVVLIDGRGFGGLVTTANYERGRSLNFGIGMLRQPVSPEDLTKAIHSYDAADAMEVSRRVRHEANLDHAILRLEDIYHSVIRETAEQGLFDPNVSRREQIAFCRSWLMHLEPSQQWLEDRTHLLSQQASLAEQLSAQSARVAELQDQAATKNNLADRLRDQIAAQNSRVAELQDQNIAQSVYAAETENQIAQRDAAIQALMSQVTRSEQSRAVRLAKFIRRCLGLTPH